MITTSKEDIERLQENLVTLRTVAGWNAEEFANSVGVSRQYYSELENNSRKLTQSLYLAMLYIFNEEGKNNKELSDVMKNCLNKEVLTNESCRELSKYISDERKRKTNETEAKKKIYGIIGATAAVSIVGIIVKAIIKK